MDTVIQNIYSRQQEIESKRIIDTDAFNYCVDILENGFPSSRPHMRHFVADTLPNKRDSVKQTEACYGDLSVKLNMQRYGLLQGKNSRLYYQNCMSEEVREALMKRFYGIHDNRILRNSPEECFDIVVVEKDEYQGSRVVLCDLRFPNGWSAHDSIGRPFNFFHTDVKDGTGKNVVPDNDKFIDFLIQSDKHHERIGAFSVRGTSDFNRHPSLPADEFNHKAYVRFERQVLFGMPEVDAFVFVIQTHIIDMKSRPELMEKAILNTKKDAYAYQTVKDHKKFLLEYINE